MTLKLAMAAILALFAADALAEDGDVPLLGLVTLSPAQQAGTDKPRVEGKVSYMIGTLDERTSDASFKSSTVEKITGPQLLAGAVAPVGPLTLGLRAGYTPLNLKVTNTQTIFPGTRLERSSDASFSIKATIAEATPLVAMNIGQHLSLGLRYCYQNLVAKGDSAVAGGAGGSTTTVNFGESATLGVALDFDKLTFGLAYETRAWRVGTAPMVTLYGRVRLGSATLGAIFGEHLQQFRRYDRGETTEGAVLDALATLDLALGKRNNLSFVTGYLPQAATGFEDYGRVDLTRHYGSGARLGAEFALVLRKALTLGFSLGVDRLGSKVDGDATLTDILVGTRIAAQI